ncbi:MAG: hypothetical protein HXS44_15190 [Theionarchaea archaeon]|nr:hypothetical protein [Theionarchaea archaeon]
MRITPTVICITIDPKETFFLLLKAFIVLFGIFAASLGIIFIIMGREQYKGLFYLIFIAVSLIAVFYPYLKNVRKPSKMKEGLEPELYGNLESTAAMILRASKGYEYSREKLEEKLGELRGEEYHITGKGAEYLKSIKNVLEDL